MNAILHKPKFLIVLLGLLFFFPFLGNTHLFDWDEINFAECAREMLVTGDYSTVQINYLPFWEKPPVFIWMQVLSMKIFGINEFAARFPNALGGIITLLVLFNAGKRLRDEKLGWWWVILYAGSLLPHLYFKSGIIDPWFNLFIFLSFYRFYLGTEELSANKHAKHFALSGLFLGLAVMTKGPVAIIIAGISLVIYWSILRFKRIFDFKSILLVLLFTLLSGSIWFLMLILSGQSHIISEFITYQIRLFSTQDSGHGGPFYYHFIILLIGCFPASVPAIGGLFLRNTEGASFRLWMKVMFWVTLLLFSIVKTKIPHYSSLCYFPLSFLAADMLYTIHDKKSIDWKKWMSILTGVIGFVLAIVLVAIPFVMMNKSLFFTAQTVKDPFALGNLEAEIGWTGLESITGFILLSGLIVFFIYVKRRDFRRAYISLTLALCLSLIGANALLLPRIEGYSQNAAITFYKDKIGKDVYVLPLGFKSYAYLFYSEKQEQSNPNHSNEIWLTSGEIDKPAYFICKIQNKEHFMKSYPLIRYTGEKNGFVFFERIP